MNHFKLFLKQFSTSFSLFWSPFLSVYIFIDMDIYHIFADHHDGTDAYTFVKKMSVFLDEMVALGKME